MRDLQIWAEENAPDKALAGEPAFWKQVCFVRDELASLFDQPTLIGVVGEHRSKSVKLPVIRIAHPQLALQFRDNLHNYVISVKSSKPVAEDVLANIVNPDYKITAAYAEGFKAEDIYGSYSTDPCEWTSYIYSTYKLYTFIHNLTFALGIQPPQNG
jgi:hypothetical protein